MTDKTITITKNTLIPLGLVITVLGGVAWLTTLYANTQENTKAIQEIRMTVDKDHEMFQQISNELSEIKGELKRMRRQ